MKFSVIQSLRKTRTACVIHFVVRGRESAGHRRREDAAEPDSAEDEQLGCLVVVLVDARRRQRGSCHLHSSPRLALRGGTADGTPQARPLRRVARQRTRMKGGVCEHNTPASWRRPRPRRLIVSRS
jgi:hypothetical protein